MSEYGTFAGSRSVERTSEALGSNFSARHQAWNWGRRSLGVFGFVLVMHQLPVYASHTFVECLRNGIGLENSRLERRFCAWGQARRKVQQLMNRMRTYTND